MSNGACCHEIIAKLTKLTKITKNILKVFVNLVGFVIIVIARRDL